MIEYRALSGLGETHLDWLQARHHFCFAGYQRADRLRWGRLRVLNHNVLAPGAATRPSSHSATELLIFAESDLEIVQSDARRVRVGAGEVASIFTGSGIEFGVSNPGSGPARFTTAWLICEQSEDLAIIRRPIAFLDAATFQASGLGGGRPDLVLKATVRITRIAVARGAQVECVLATRDAYLLVVQGRVSLAHQVAGRHDGVVIKDEPVVTMTGAENAIVLVMEV